MDTNNMMGECGSGINESHMGMQSTGMCDDFNRNRNVNIDPF